MVIFQHTISQNRGNLLAFVEALTDRMEEEATAYIERIDEMGGILEAIEKGFPQQEIAEAAFEFQTASAALASGWASAKLSATRPPIEWPKVTTGRPGCLAAISA